jgi:hypothetical protein
MCNPWRACLPAFLLACLIGTIFCASAARASELTVDYSTGGWSWVFDPEEEVTISGIEAQWGAPAASGASALFNLSATATKDSIQAEWTGRPEPVGLYFANGGTPNAVLSPSSVILYLQDISADEADGLVLSNIVITPTSSWAALFETYAVDGDTFNASAETLGALAPSTNSAITALPGSVAPIPAVPEPGSTSLVFIVAVAAAIACRRLKGFRR